jgi:hypothetical protein
VTQPDLDLGLLARFIFGVRSLFGGASAFGLGFALGAGLASAIIPHFDNQYTQPLGLKMFVSRGTGSGYE